MIRVNVSALYSWFTTLKSTLNILQLSNEEQINCIGHSYTVD